MSLIDKINKDNQIKPLYQYRHVLRDLLKSNEFLVLKVNSCNYSSHVTSCFSPKDLVVSISTPLVKKHKMKLEINVEIQGFNK